MSPKKEPWKKSMQLWGQNVVVNMYNYIDINITDRHME